MTDQAFIETLQKTALDAAWRAGQIIQEQFDRPKAVHLKGPRDPVTETDQAAQDVIIDVIRRKFPDHAILAEEDSANHNQQNGEWLIPGGVVWVVDPLDGTTNYTNDLPLVSVSVGVEIDGEPAAGVIYAPVLRELFQAGRGLGAAFNGHPLPLLKPRSLDAAVVAFDWSRSEARRRQVTKVVDVLVHHCHTMRSLGSAALELAYVAAGRLGVYFNYGLQPWDVAAGAIILREVGAELRGIDGGPWRLDRPGVLAGHPDLLDAAQGLIDQAAG